jgi:hypothetical protein
MIITLHRFHLRKYTFLFVMQSRFEEAIKICEEGTALEENSSIKSGIDIENTLALALRDTKSSDNIVKP